MIELLKKRRNGLRMGVVKIVVFNFYPQQRNLEILFERRKQD